MSMSKLSAGAGYKYLLRHTACGDVERDPSTPLTAYYTASGYPPGTWWGSGLAGLGPELAAGSVVTEEAMSRLYGGGRHPGTEEPLGHAYAVFRSTDQRIADAVAALPDSMTDSARDDAVAGITRIETARRPRVAVAGFDLTFTAPKSASVLWALADTATQAAVVAAHRAAVRDALAFLEQRAVHTRVGVNSCAQVPTNGMVASLFDHWDTRTGDPNLHTHVVVANKVQGLDGVWRSLDSRALHHAAVAVSELYDNLFADQLAARVPVTWSWRSRGPRRTPAFEIDDVPDPLLAEFSTRSAAIEAAMTTALVDFHASHRRGPTRVETTRIRQRVTTATRPAKTLHRLPDLMSWWRQRAVSLLDRAPHLLMTGSWPGRPRGHTAPSSGDGVRHGVRRGVRHPLHGADPTAGQVLSPRARWWPRRPRTRRGPLSEEAVAHLGDAVIGQVMGRRSTWTRWNLTAEACRLTRGIRLPTAGARVELADRVVAAALARCVPLDAPEQFTVPASFRRADGSSVFTRPEEDRFTHRVVLDAETRLLDALTDTAAPRADADAAARIAGSPQPGRRPGDPLVHLAPDQVHAITAVATSGRQLEVLVGPAGTGKTTTLRALRTAWESTHGPGSVIGLAPSSTAAHELSRALGVECENTAKWIHETDGQAGTRRRDLIDGLLQRHETATAAGDGPAAARIERALARVRAEEHQWSLRPGQLLIVDEASLAGTLTLDTLTTQARAAGAKVLLVGDHLQLSAIDAGGAFGLLAATPHAVELRSLWRFTHRWEAHATRALRHGHSHVLSQYERHGRLHEGSGEVMLDAAYDAWHADRDHGSTALLIAADTATVTTLNQRAHDDQVAAGHVDPQHSLRLADGLHAGVGDLVLTRRNDRTVHLPDGNHVRNGTHWTLHAAHRDGSATLRLPEGPTVTVPADYVREHLELGYACTIHRAQGLTVDHAHLLASPAMTREALYVAMTRGRISNHAYVPVDETDPGCGHLPDPGQLPPTGRELMDRILTVTGRETSATEARQARHGTAPLPAVAATLAAAALDTTTAPTPADVAAPPYGGDTTGYPDLDHRSRDREGLSR
jgi:conjugative relaxase-like TrwC/TraI family protein